MQGTNTVTPGLSSSETVEDMKKNYKKIYDELQKMQDAYQKSFDSIVEINKKYTEKLTNTNPYQQVLDKMKEEQAALSADVDYYRNAKQKRLEIDKWYAQEYEKINKDKNLSSSQKSSLYSSLDTLYDERSLKANEDVWVERGEKIGDIVGDGLKDILTEFDNFDGTMRDMSTRLMDFLIQESMQALLAQVSNLKVLQGIAAGLNVGAQKGGFIGAASGLLKGVGKFFGLKFHSGGVVPVGANAELPGTKEQLALLKGGERVLSPAESTGYEREDKSPVVFNNFNIKAWDSKDVQKYLLENKQLLNSITYEGIKNNNSHLRNIVQNA